MRGPRGPFTGVAKWAYVVPFVQVEVKKAEPRDSKAPGQLGPGQWVPRGILSAANGWTTQPAQGWQQPYGPQGEWEHLWSTFLDSILSTLKQPTCPSSLLQGVWVSTTGQPIGVFSSHQDAFVSIHILASGNVAQRCAWESPSHFSECAGSSLSFKAQTCTRRGWVGRRHFAAHVITDS